VSVLSGALPRLLDVHLHKLMLECRARPCRRFTLSHRLLRRDGIFLGDAWYCSAACFEDALRRRLAAAALGCAEPRLRVGRMPFRLILVDRGVLSAAQLGEALRLQWEHGGPLEDALIAQGVASDAQIASAKAAEAGCALVLRPPAVAPALQLPSGLMHRYRAAIVHASDTGLLLGFTRRLSPLLLAAAQQLTGARAEACFLPEPIFRDMLGRAPSGDTGVAPFSAETNGLASATQASAPDSAADAARRVLRWAVEAGSERARLATGDRWAWVRLSGGRNLDFYLPLKAGDSLESAVESKEIRIPS
jgi:hypothetical protein